MKLKQLITLISLCAGIHQASAQGYVVNLDAAQSGGGGRTGSGQVFLFLTGSTLSVSNGTYSGLSGIASAAHIHGPSGVLPGSAGVLYGLDPAFVSTGASFGNFIAGNLTLLAGAGGFSIAQQQSQLAAGQWYINIHSSTFGGGEIRGQIYLAPEPASSTLLIGGGIWLLARLKINRRTSPLP
jgi:CHRD domain